MVVVIRRWSSRGTGAWLLKLNCPQIPHIRVSLTLPVRSRGFDSSARAGRQDFETFGTGPIGAWAHCPNPEGAPGNGKSRPAFTQRLRKSLSTVQEFPLQVAKAISKKNAKIDALGVVIQLVPVDREPRRYRKMALAIRFHPRDVPE